MTHCQLCDEPRHLLRSHVVPEFFYKPVYDKKHRLLTRLDGRLAGTPPLQKGLRERLLCNRCEQKFGRHEAYGRDLLYGQRITDALRPYTEATIRPVVGRIPRAVAAVDRVGGFWTVGELSLPHVDYRRLRLFGLSLLWRMAIASHEIWRPVDFGSDRAVLKEMLKSDDPGAPDQFPFVCMVPLFNGRFFHDVMFQPDVITIGGAATVRLLLGGYLFVFLQGAASPTETLRPFFVQPSGQWAVPIVDAMHLDFLRADARKIQVAILREEGLPIPHDDDA
jgi:hypothetical protein